MRDKYADAGNEAAVLRTETRISDVKRNMTCDICHCNPCQCDALHDKGMDREMFPDEG